MLCELSIKNFAIIDDLRIAFSPGMTILSGETGAGKSIIINAVNLLLGSRASASLIRSGCDTAELEVYFEVPSHDHIRHILSEMDLDCSDGLIIQRIISHNNRHKIYINGRLATMQTLQGLAENLASISGQHAHQGLLKEDVHLQLLDEFAGLMPLRQSVGKLYKDLLPLIEKRKKLDLVQKQKAERLELLSFQKNEIQSAEVKTNEDVQLEQEKLRLKNSELLYQSVFNSIGGLYDAQGSAFERLIDVQKALEKLHAIDPAITKITDAISSAVYQVEDVTGDLRHYLRNIETDSHSLELVEDRLDILNRLKRKYGGSIAAIQDKQAAIETELSQIETVSDQIKQTEAALKTVYDQLAAKAKELSEKRKAAAVTFAKKVQTALAELMMPQTRFSIDLRPAQAGKTDNSFLAMDGHAIGETGIDAATFMIAPNVGEDEKPLSEIASGGELSRVVLALKAILAGTESVETLVFDEVDAGIGGEAAEVVGKKLASLSKFHQVICITHLPQIAKYGDHHFKISKHVQKGRTHTMIKAIFENDRVAEIARMMGGNTITQKALEHAKEMLNRK